MPTIVHYVREPGIFDPEALSVMGIAYERALRALPTSPPADVREVMAARIISGAGKGERNPEKLCQSALSALRVEADQ